MPLTWLSKSRHGSDKDAHHRKLALLGELHLMDRCFACKLATNSAGQYSATKTCLDMRLLWCTGAVSGGLRERG